MIKIAVTALSAGMILAQDIFVDEHGRMLLLAKDIILTDRQISLLKKHGVLHAYVTGEKKPEQSLLPLPRPLLAPQIKAEALHDLNEVFDFFRNNIENRQQALIVLKQIDTLADQLVKCLSEDKNTLVHITDLKCYDEYTYHHSLSVAILSIAIGQALGLDEHKLYSLSKCAIMHDIGKTAVPTEIINKQAKLNKEEYSIAKSHAPAGYRCLNKYAANNPELLSAVLFHHERYDGNGYPYGLKGDRIPLFSRIIAVADVYDALTSHRPYRLPESPGEALEYIMGNAEMAFDYDIICALMNKLELYPVGSVVCLSSGQKAVVIDNKNTLRPLLRLLENDAVIDLYTDFSKLNLTINNILPFGN
ncbi:MAG: HD-GYP domain-containing protein [Firmicutes bacterium]|nr:HD-GYP domain-containing protein [Bacillota bacterium]